jgi:hypothetical protein
MVQVARPKAFGCEHVNLQNGPATSCMVGTYIHASAAAASARVSQLSCLSTLQVYAGESLLIMGPSGAGEAVTMHGFDHHTQ